MFKTQAAIMNKRRLVLAAGLAVAAWLAWFGDKTPRSDIAEPVARQGSSRPPAAETRGVSGAGKPPAAVSILALEDREHLIGGAQAEKPAHGIFTSHSWTPPPPPPPPPPKPVPPPPPMAPPLPFTYLGKKVEDGIWEVYLARGERTYIVRAQTMIDGTYRAESIQPPTLVLTYLPLDQKQTLTIGGTD
jgi:hypothetical protein